MGRAPIIAMVIGVLGFGPAVAHQAHRDGPPPRAVDLADLPAKYRIENVRYCRKRFFVATGEGAVHEFDDFNLLLKVDSGQYGPRAGAPVLVPADASGERAFMIFSHPAEITSFLNAAC